MVERPTDWTHNGTSYSDTTRVRWASVRAGEVERGLPAHATREEEPAVRDTPRPTLTRDLDDESVIAEMVRRFYADVAQDELLGPMFNDVGQVDWSEHL